ncbi:MAG: SH3 domain-containing protein [Flammeovirgaceae bacterium]|nr:SH3 domain-containing protein [Flammeovirgaceae bacterium]
MAFIKENEGDFTNTLYYLNLYYLFKADKKVLDKMMDLASDNELKGYKFTDAEFFFAFYHANLYYVFGGVLATFIFLLILIIKNKINKRDVLIPAIFLTSFIALFFFTINFGLDSQKGIIINDHSFLMEQPSAGANLIEEVGKGHRVEIISKNDIWYEILWDKETVYIRENNLVLIN